MNQIELEKYGFAGRFTALASTYRDLYPGRVLSQAKDLYRVMCSQGEIAAEVSGKFRFDANAPSEFPAVGDFVMLDRETDANGNAIIHCVLPRKSAFYRKAAGRADTGQIVASNIDTVFICMSLNKDFNLRRLERYLAIAWDSGAIPVVILTKADLCEDLEQKILEVNTAAIGVDVLVVSAVRESGCMQVLDHIKEGQTAAFIGSSGVGKSTLINRLVGENRLDTRGLRNDDKGRHTTTSRQLILLPEGGMVIDTPGMREIGLESADLSRTFAEIDELASRCRFSDCTHSGEPGCEVQRAVREGELSEERLQSYEKLKKEARYEGLNSRQIESTKLNTMFSEVGGMKKARKYLKEKDKRR